MGEEEQQQQQNKKVHIPGTENLNSFADKRTFVWLRDGRKLFGVLRSYDQFANLTLTDTYERFYAGLEYAQVYHGVYLIRGENVVLCGDFDEAGWEGEQRRMAKFHRPVEHVLPMVQEQMQQLEAARKAMGARSEFAEYDLY